MPDETQFPTFDASRVIGPQTDIPIPDEIGGFRILSLLGRGGMGIVYEAEQLNPRRRVALKVIRGGGPVNELRLRLFRREAETLARLVHPNIAAIYEAGQTEDGQHFFTMELVAGQPLDVYVREHMGGERPSPSQLRDRLRLFETICRAVSYAHQRGVIHRDLKPSNILVEAPLAPTTGSHTSDTSRLPQVKILDFGLARIADADSQGSLLTELGDIRGTLPYMSPEQARGDSREIDLRSDVYALGVVLYELLTGHFPYETQTGSLVGALRAICEEAPKPLRQSFEAGYRVDPDLQTIVGKALEKEPDRRYASADALAEDVERYLSNQPILAHPPSTAYHLRKAISRHRVASVMAAGILVLLVAGGIAMTVQAERIRRERDRAEQQAARAKAINQFLERTFGAADPWQRGVRGVSLVDALKQAQGQVHAAFSGQPAAEADVLETIAKTYTGLGQLGEAESLLRRALKLRGASGGRQTTAAAGTLSLLANALQQQGRWPDAAVVSREELAIRRRLDGPESGPAAAAMDALASALSRKGEFPEAEKLAAESLRIRRRVFGDGSDEVAFSLQTTGVLAFNQDDSKRYEKVTRERLAILRKNHGNESPQVTSALNDLAVARMSQGDLAGAEKIFQEAIENLRRLFGEDHPDLATDLENLGNVWFQLGRHAETLRNLERVGAMRRRAFGDDSEPVARTVANRATVTSIMGDAAAAEPLYREAEEKLSRFLGPDNPDVAQVLKGHGRNLQRLGKLDEAERALRRALKIELASFPAGSTPVARTRLFLGRVLTDRKDYPAADEMLRLADESYRKNQGVADLATQQTIQARVDLYRKWGKPEKARELEAELAPAKPAP